MNDLNLDKLKAGELDIEKLKENLEIKIRNEVESSQPGLPEAAKEAIVRSRLKITLNNTSANVIKENFGENAGKNIKSSLFE